MGRLWLLLLFGGLGLTGCGDPNVPLTQPPQDAFRVSTPRPPRTDLYPTPTPLPTPTPTPAPTLLELSARWLQIPWPPQRQETSLVRLSARFLQISLPERPRSSESPHESPQPQPSPSGTTAEEAKEED